MFLTFPFSNDQRTWNINLPLSSPGSRFQGWVKLTTLKEARYPLHEEGIYWVHYLIERPLSKFVYTVRSLNEDWEPSHNDSVSAGTTLYIPVACTSCMHTAMNHTYLQNWTHYRPYKNYLLFLIWSGWVSLYNLSGRNFKTFCLQAFVQRLIWALILLFINIFWCLSQTDIYYWWIPITYYYYYYYYFYYYYADHYRQIWMIIKIMKTVKMLKQFLVAIL